MESELLLEAEVEKRTSLSHELKSAKAEHAGTLSCKSRYHGVNDDHNCPTQSSRHNSTHIAAEPQPTSAFAFAKDTTGFVAILQPLWETLPSSRSARGMVQRRHTTFPRW